MSTVRAAMSPTDLTIRWGRCRSPWGYAICGYLGALAVGVAARCVVTLLSG
jgi:hypothetical protein